MTCPKCGSNYITSEQKYGNITVKAKSKSHNFLWWLLLGWAFVIYKAVTFIFKAIYFVLIGWWVKLLKKRSQKRKEQTVVHICQNCGHRWETIGMDKRYFDPEVIDAA